MTRYATVRIYDARRQNVVTIHFRSCRIFDEVYVLKGALGGWGIDWRGEVLRLSNRSLGKDFEVNSVIRV